MKRKKSLVAYILLLVCLLCGCQTYDGAPSDDDIPELPPLTGVYESEYGTLEFNGDGESVKVHLSKIVPDGIVGEMKIQWTLQHREYRWDRADNCIISDGEDYYKFDLSVLPTTEEIRMSLYDSNVVDAEDMDDVEMVFLPKNEQ